MEFISVPIWLLYVVAGLAVVAVGSAYWWRRRPAVRSRDGHLLSTALNNMTQGVVLVDDKETVLVCN